MEWAACRASLPPGLCRTSRHRRIVVHYAYESEDSINDALKGGAGLPHLLRTLNDRRNDGRGHEGVLALGNRKFRLAVSEHFFKQGVADFSLERAFKVALEAAMMCFSMFGPILLRFPNDAQETIIV